MLRFFLLAIKKTLSNAQRSIQLIFIMVPFEFIFSLQRICRGESKTFFDFIFTLQYLYTNLYIYECRGVINKLN